MNNIQRTCIVCKNKFNQNELKRIVCFNNEILVQENVKLSGRGAYICSSKDCLDNLVKTKALNRAFKKNINNETYEEVINKIKN